MQVAALWSCGGGGKWCRNSDRRVLEDRDSHRVFSVRSRHHGPVQAYARPSCVVPAVFPGEASGCGSLEQPAALHAGKLLLGSFNCGDGLGADRSLHKQRRTNLVAGRRAAGRRLDGLGLGFVLGVECRRPGLDQRCVGATTSLRLAPFDLRGTSSRRVGGGVASRGDWQIAGACQRAWPACHPTAHAPGRAHV